MEETMALILNNLYNITSHYGKRIGNILYTGVSKVMLSYGGNHFTILSVCNFLRKHLKNYFYTKWYHTKSKDKDITKSLFSCEKSILQVRGCIHKENAIVSINPSCKQNFINIQLDNRLQVSTKNIQST